MGWGIPVPYGILLLMSVLAVDGDFTPAYVFGPPTHHPLKNCPSNCFISFRALGEGFFGKFFCKSECIWQITFVDVFVNGTAILLEGFAFKSFIDFFPNILYLCRCLLALFFVITSINLSADVSFTLCECTVPWVPLGSFCKLVSDFPLSNNHMLKWI